MESKLSGMLSLLHFSTNALSEGVDGPYQRTLLDLFSSTETPMLLVGGIAVNFWIREPRATQDIDIAVATPSAFDDLVKQIEKKFRRVAGEEFMLQHKDSGVSVDVLTVLLGGRVLEEALEDPELIALSGTTIRIAKPVYLIGLKLARAMQSESRKSLLDQHDIIALIQDTSPDLELVMPVLDGDERKLLLELNDRSKTMR